MWLFVTFYTVARFENYWQVFRQKSQFNSAILHDFCKMCAFSVAKAAVTGHGVNSNWLFNDLWGGRDWKIETIFLILQTMGDKKAGWEGEKKEKHLPMHTKVDYLHRKQMENRPSLHNRSFYSREGKVRMCKSTCIIRAHPRGSNTPPLGANLIERN